MYHFELNFNNFHLKKMKICSFDCHNTLTNGIPVIEIFFQHN